MLRIGLICVSMLLLTQMCDAYKVLLVFSWPGKSHGILGEGIVRNLLEAGHEVTYMSPLSKDHKKHGNLTVVDTSSLINLMPEDEMNLVKVMNKEVDMTSITGMWDMLIDIQEASLAHENAQKLFRDPSVTFDVIVAEWMFCDVYAALPALYDCPFIWFSTVDPHWMVLQLIDEIPNPAYNADALSSSTVPFSFFQRAKELFTIITISGIEYFKVSGVSGEMYNKQLVPIIKLKGKKVPDFENLRYNASLMLGNSHISMGHSIRLPQLYKSIGGYHIETEVKPLPKDLKNLLDNAKTGLIYFSMGSTVKTKEMPNELKESLLKMFGSLKQTVLWKFEEELPNKPSNVHIADWVPQQSILAHPNCVLFITHGGLLSTTEAIHFGKPIIGIPVFADQFNNVERAVSRGIAKRVDLSFTMADELEKSIHEILSDPSYSKKAKELSFVYHHRPVSPGKELVHWVEHVVATRGAPHLRSPALLVSWYQKLYLDLSLVIIVILYSLFFLIKLVSSKVCSKTVGIKKKNI